MASSKHDDFLEYYDLVDQIRLFVASSLYITDQKINTLSELLDLCNRNEIDLYEKDLASYLTSSSGVVLEQQSTIAILLNAAVTRDLVSFAVTTKKTLITDESVVAYLKSRWCVDWDTCCGPEYDDKQQCLTPDASPAVPSTTQATASSDSTLTLRTSKSISTILHALRKFLSVNQFRLKVAPILVSISKISDESIIVNSRQDTIGDILKKIQGKWSTKSGESLSFDIYLGILYSIAKSCLLMKRTADEIDLDHCPATLAFYIQAPLFDEEHGFSHRLKGSKSKLYIHPLQKEITSLTLSEFLTSKYRVVVPGYIAV